MTSEDLLWCVRISQIPDEYDRLLFQRHGRDQPCRLGRIPSNGTCSFATVVVEGQALFLGLHIPYCDEPSAAPCDKDVRYPLVPVETFDIVRSCSCASEPYGCA